MINKIVKFNVKPEHIQTFKSALVEHKQNTQKETHFVAMRIYVDNHNSHLFFIYERFEDQQAVDFHITQPYTVKFGELLDAALAKPAEVFNLGETNPAPIALKAANPEDELFNLFFIFKIKNGNRVRLLKQFEDHVRCTRQEEQGNLLFDLYTVEGDANTLAVYEHWRKESDVWDIHFNQPYAKVTGALMEEAVVGDMQQYMSFVTEI
ncbi:MAG: quinol monooxygenase YgiN [Psychromonas sp.]|jgi:quinol monooxygenase YgiN|uniref:putative quinol monooxygenase n=1 Tax=Psychromonas sp. TaxID=1884585 RepID=UPI0039E3AE6B